MSSYLLPSEQVTFPTYFDSTMLAEAKACKHKLWLNFIQKLSTKIPSPHLHAGAAFAHACHVTRQLYYGTDKKSADVAIATGLHALFQAYGDYEAPSESNKTWDRVATAFVSYFTEEYPLEHDTLKPVIDRRGNPLLEYRFAIPIEIPHPETGEPILLAGRFDMLGEGVHGLAVVDEKLVKSFNYGWSDQWQLRGQFIQYVWACQYANLRVERAIVRGVNVLQKEINFREAIVNIPDWRIETWLSSTYSTIHELINSWRMWKLNIPDRHAFPLNLSDACTSYGGCQFRPMCEVSRPQFWLNDYRVRRWNPLLQNPEEENESCPAPSSPQLPEVIL